ncbi:MAG: 3'-5' exoribonuclease domain-containing protein [Fibrobacterota bacterium]
MSFISIDIEADGPIPGDYSMIALGAVVVETGLTRSFYNTIRPISDKYIQRSLQVCGFSRNQTMGFTPPQIAMHSFHDWIDRQGGHNPFFVSDNNGFDWQFVNWYFHHYIGDNPFGFSSTNLVSLFKGIHRDMYAQFSHFRGKTEHNALEDARRNALALLEMSSKYGLHINLG